MTLILFSAVVPKEPHPNENVNAAGKITGQDTLKKPRTDYMLTKLWSDPETNGRFFLQARHLFADEIFGPDNKSQVWARHLFPVMHKLTAMKYHLETYKQIESRDLSFEDDERMKPRS